MKRGFSIAAAVVLLASQALQAGQESTPAIAGGVFAHVAGAHDSWASLASRFGVEAVILAAQNGRLPAQRLREGELVHVDNRHLLPARRPDGITINIPQRLLFVLDGGRLVGSYPIGAGQPGWPTFTGAFTVVRKEVDPVWDVPLSIQREMRAQGKQVVTQVPAGPNNPLGKYWLGLSAPGFGIHGTSAPLSIYRFQSHGCIRLHNADIEALFAQVSEGTPGEAIYEPVLLRIVGGDVLLEAHRDVYRRQPQAEARVAELARELNVLDRLDWTAVRQVLNLRAGQPQAVQSVEVGVR
jgi:L,D-transpeptidase ErfK/SrfK